MEGFFDLNAWKKSNDETLWQFLKSFSVCLYAYMHVWEHRINAIKMESSKFQAINNDEWLLISSFNYNPIG